MESSLIRMVAVPLMAGRIRPCPPRIALRRTHVVTADPHRCFPTSWVDTRTTIGTLLVAPAKLPNQAAEPFLRLQNAVTAAATGAAVSLTATIGGDAVFLATIDARVPLGLPEPGSRVPPGTAPARVHTEIGCPAPIVDADGYLAHINCVAVAVPLGRGQVAAVTTLVAGQHPPLGLSAATRAAGTRIAVLLGTLPA